MITNIYGKVFDGINDTIDKLSFWLESNKLVIYKNKFQAISFGGTNETP